jgi:hemerythrin
MTTISWTNEYAVDIRKIDNQHKSIIDHINVLYDAMMNNKGHDELGEILEKLTVYAGNHYRTEEIYMISYGFTDIDLHRIEHRTFIRQLELFKNRYKDGNAVLTSEFILYLKQWILKHIQGSDKSLSIFLKNFGIQ